MGLRGNRFDASTNLQREHARRWLTAPGAESTIESMEDAALAPGARLMGLIDAYAARWGLSDADVARRIAIAPTTLLDWRRRGVRQLPDRAVLEAIAATLGIDYERVLQAVLADTGHWAPSSGRGPHAAGEVMQLGAYADMLPSYKLPAFEVPSVHLVPGHDAGASRTARNRAFLHLVDADDPGLVVIAGYIDFLVIGLGAASASVEAETLSGASVYAPLFPDGMLRGGLLDDSDGDGPGSWVLLVEDLFIDPGFRGQWLAAWMVATIAQRVTDQSGAGLIVICPHTPDVLHTNRDDDAEDLSQRSRTFWQDHLRMAATSDGFLLVCTASDAFTDACDELKVVNDVFIMVDREQLVLRRRNNDRKLWPATGAPQPAGHTDNGDHQAGCATSYFGEQVYTDLNRIIDSVHDRSDMTYASVTAVISFVGPDPANRQQGNVFARAADYLSEHPEVVVSSTHWRDFTDDRGAEMYALDVEVIPPAWRDALLR